ncbi:CvpA family protein [Candidatus Microgenomates bacterium]|nr:CvpA family protein [Candidatus Microgenomates bacterium]
MFGVNLPFLHGNWIDLIIIIILFWFFWEGIGKGFITGIVDLSALFASSLIALKTYWVFSFLLVGNFSLPKGISDAVGFLLAGIIGEALFTTAANFIIRRIPQSFFSSRIEKTLGFIPSFLNGLLLVAFFLTVLLALPINPALKSAIISSKIGSPIVLKTQGFERTLNNVFGGAINDTLNFLTVNKDDENIDLRFIAKKFTVDNVSEEQMWSLINQERKKINLPPLSSDANLQTLAREHAQDMLTKGYFSHNTPEGLTPFDRMKNKNINYQAAGENLAFAPNVEIAHVGLMNSPGHRKNILNQDFGKVGIGVIDAGVYGKMFVQEFTN